MDILSHSRKLHSSDFNNLFSLLKSQFYVNVPFKLNKSVIEDALIAFFKFLDEPETIKSHIDFTISPKHRRGDIGFKNRVATEHMYNDNKDFFHFHPSIFKKYPDFIKSNPVVSDFLNKAMPIWDTVYLTIDNILTILDKHFPGVHSKVLQGENVHVILRFLKYEWQTSGKYLAKPHFDAGSFSLAIAESCPGLRIGSCPEDLKLVEHKPDEAIFMLSSNFKKIMPTDELSAGWHDVIQLDDNQIGKPYARWALVAFIEAQDVEALPRCETHKWYSSEIN